MGNTVATWTTDEVADYLEGHNLGQYAAAVRENGIDGEFAETMAAATPDEVNETLTSLGVTGALDQMRCRTALRKVCSDEPPSKREPPSQRDDDTMIADRSVRAAADGDEDDTMVSAPATASSSLSSGLKRLWGAATGDPGGRVCVSCGKHVGETPVHDECRAITVDLDRARHGNVAQGSILNGKLRLKRVLGAGGFGAVWVAEDMALRRDIAVKVLLLKGMDEAMAITRVRRFHREANVGSEVSHAHILRAFDFGQDPATGTLFLGMELCLGRSLKQVLADDGPLEEVAAVRVCVQTLDALQALHEAGVAHRDVKPANVMLDDDTVKLIDLGIAKRLGAAESEEAGKGDSSITATLSAEGVVASLPYTAPERLEVGARAGAEADVFGVGILLYELCTGDRPFKGNWAAQGHGTIMRQPFPEAALVARVSAPVVAACKRACHFNPQRRFASAAAMAAALAPLSPREGVVAPPAAAALVAVADDAGGAIEEDAAAEDRWAGSVAVTDEASLAALLEEVSANPVPLRELGIAHMVVRAPGSEDAVSELLNQVTTRRMPELRALHVVHSWVPNLPSLIGRLVAMPHLVDVNLSGTPRLRSQASTVASLFRRLERLSLSECNLSRHDGTTIATELHKAKKLQMLDLSDNNDLQGVPARKILEAAGKLPNLGRQGVVLEWTAWDPICMVS